MEHIDLTELLDVEESYSALPLPGLLCGGLGCGGGTIGAGCGALCGGGGCGGACAGAGCGGVC